MPFGFNFLICNKAKQKTEHYIDEKNGEEEYMDLEGQYEHTHILKFSRV